MKSNLSRLLGLATAGLMAGCYSSFEVHLDPEVDAGPVIVFDAAAPDAVSPDAGPPVGPGQPPPRPTSPDGRGRSVSFALRDPVLDPGVYADGGWVQFSYDLDGVRTNDVRSTSCEAQVISVDGPDGEDNVLGGFLLESLQLATDGSFEEEARARMMEGLGVPLVHVQDWSGDEDDPRVRVWIAPTGAVENPAGDDRPSWMGTDTFYADPLGFEGGSLEGTPVSYDAEAYVAGGTLVARFDTLTLALPVQEESAPFEIVVRGAIFSGEITADGARLEDVRFTGRWPLAGIRDALDSVGICAGTEQRLGAELLLQQFADITADPADDGQDLTCDAMSAGLGLTGYAVDLAGVTRSSGLPELPDPCP